MLITQEDIGNMSNYFVARIVECDKVLAVNKFRLSVKLALRKVEGDTGSS